MGSCDAATDNPAERKLFAFLSGRRVKRGPPLRTATNCCSLLCMGSVELHSKEASGVLVLYATQLWHGSFSYHHFMLLCSEFVCSEEAGGAPHADGGSRGNQEVTAF